MRKAKPGPPSMPGCCESSLFASKAVVALCSFYTEWSVFKQLQLGKAILCGTAPWPLLLIRALSSVSPFTSTAGVLYCNIVIKQKGTPWGAVRHLAQLPTQPRGRSYIYLFVSLLGLVLFFCELGWGRRWKGKLET